MNPECGRIADQLRRAFQGNAWHGLSLRELLSEITPEQASARPFPRVHSIWELVLHIHGWTQAALRSTQGSRMPATATSVPPEQDWPPVREKTEKAWREALGQLFSAGELLASAIESFGDPRLSETVPGREYDFYFLFHGVVQHSLYHAGQIAILKKELSSSS
jgi:uncharacterized damage-inducible protein DinB